jgi:hypothetical protein
MKKPSSRIREEIAKLQEALRAAETKEAERIGRIALKAGLGEFEIEDGVLQTAFEHLTRQFRDVRTDGKRAIGRGGDGTSSATTSTLPPGTSEGRSNEA